MTNIKNIEIEKIAPHPNNPRADLGDLSELAESIGIKGVLQNLTVVPITDGLETVRERSPEAEYVAVIGHRRLAAAKIAGLKEVPCAVSGMSFSEQIETMLIENIQRSDLTVFEQAQGFQLMMDLGETVGGIAEKTGFSETTVRRRVELTELDPEKFKAASDRGATLTDFAELSKIKDTDLRNKALESAGTPNFEWEIKSAAAEEARRKGLLAAAAALEEFAEKAEEEETKAMECIRLCFGLKDCAKPADADGTVKYFFTASRSESFIRLYADRSREEPKEKDRAEAEKAARRAARKKALEEAEARVREIHDDFIRVCGNAKAKKNMSVIADYAWREMMRTAFPSGGGILARVFGVSRTGRRFTAKNVPDSFSSKPEHCLLMTVYGNLLSVYGSVYSDPYGRHVENEGADFICEFLEKLGYEPSDAERALRDGTHELYATREEEEAEEYDI